MILQNHLETIEKILLARAEIQRQAAHSTHKGVPREAFIREFLSTHLSETVGIGTGEIIDINSEPGIPDLAEDEPKRPQVDIVIYRRNYPKLDFGGGINIFLAESVIATIEIKSTLTKEEMYKSLDNAVYIKNLSRNMIGSNLMMVNEQSNGNILNFVVSYNEPQKMDTIVEWIKEYHRTNNITQPQTGNQIWEWGSSPSIDGVFVLGTGYIYLPLIEYGRKLSDISWLGSKTKMSALLPLFILLTDAISAPQYDSFHPEVYINQYNPELTAYSWV